MRHSCFRLLTVASLVVAMFCAGCAGFAGRIPSTHHAEHLIQKYFAHYGHKYPSTVFKNHRIAKIEFLSLHEIQKDLAQAEVFLTLEGNDNQLIKARVTFKKRTLRWKILYWEDLSPTPSQPTSPPL